MHCRTILLAFVSLSAYALAKLSSKISVANEGSGVSFANPERLTARHHKDLDDADAEFDLSAVHEDKSLEALYDWNWSWLNKLLKNVRVELPDISVKEGIITLYATGLYCEKFQVGNIELHDETQSVLTIDVEDVIATCHGHYKVALFDGDFTASVTKSQLTTGIGLTFDPATHLPSASNMKSCAVDVTLDVNFSGSISAGLINLFRKPIADAIANEAKAQVCTLVGPIIQTNGTAALQTLDKTLEPFFNTPTPTPSPTPHPNTISWPSFPPLTALHNLITRLTTPSPELTSLLLLLFPEGHAHVLLPGNEGIVVPTILANFTFDILGVGISHIDSLLFANLLDPLGPAELGNSFKFGRLGLVVDTWMVLDSKVSPGQHVANNISFEIRNDNFEFDEANDLEIFSTYSDILAPIPVVQLSNLNCSVRPLISSFFLTHLNASFTGRLSLNVSGYDPDFDVVMSNLFEVFYSIVDDAVPVMLSNGLNSMGVPLANLLVGGVLNNMVCPPPPQPTSQYVDLRTMELLTGLNKLVNQDFTKHLNINSLIGVFTNNTGAYLHPDTVISTAVLDDKAGSLQVHVWGLNLTNLDSFTNVTFMTPRIQSPYVVDTNISFAGPGTTRPLVLTFSLAVSYTTKETNTTTTSSYSFTLTITDVQLTCTLTLLLDAAKYYGLTFQDLFNPDKVKDLIDDLEIEALDLHIGGMTLTHKPTSDSATHQLPAVLSAPLSLFNSLEFPLTTSLLPHLPTSQSEDLLTMLHSSLISSLLTPTPTPTVETPQPTMPPQTPTTTTTPTPETNTINTINTINTSNDDDDKDSHESSSVFVPVGLVVGAAVLVGVGMMWLRNSTRKTPKITAKFLSLSEDQDYVAAPQTKTIKQKARLSRQ